MYQDRAKQDKKDKRQTGSSEVRYSSSTCMEVNSHLSSLLSPLSSDLVPDGRAAHAHAKRPQPKIRLGLVRACCIGNARRMSIVCDSRQAVCLPGCCS